MDGSYEHHLTPSSEWRFHRDILLARPELNAVVHAHPIFCTSIAIRGMDVPAIHYMIAAAGGNSIRCAAYHTFGTAELSDAAVRALEDRTACLLANHGMIATGSTMARAMWLAIEVETLARLYFNVLQLGEPVILPVDEIARVVEKFKTYGMTTEREA
jgi:L-fuculose-phosphate aldolase